MNCLKCKKEFDEYEVKYSIYHFQIYCSHCDIHWKKEFDNVLEEISDFSIAYSIKTGDTYHWHQIEYLERTTLSQVKKASIINPLFNGYNLFIIKLNKKDYEPMCLYSWKNEKWQDIIKSERYYWK